MTGLFFLLVIIPSAIIHEYMHGWMADRLGDPTARYAGRLSLNPVVHVDPIGTLLLPFFLFFSTGGAFLFAYAKPVPFNSLNLRNQQWGPVAVAFAGPMSNFILAAVFGLFIQFFPGNPMNIFFVKTSLKKQLKKKDLILLVGERFQLIEKKLTLDQQP